MIHILEKQVADRIAAGEVVDRPRSVVKELVENAIDAGASEIGVAIEGGGKRLIRVTDNGSGMERQDVEKAFLRHATSKITAVKDLFSLYTLGFRGEALASIGAVSKVELITHTAEEKTGVQAHFQGGRMIEKSSVGAPTGTTLIVRDLFYNTPAREKFLKSEGTEAGLIIDLLQRMALTRPDIRFSLESNGKSILQTGGGGNLKETIAGVYKEREYFSLLPLTGAAKGLQVSGFLSPPALSKSNRRSEFFFVNGRVVDSRILRQGLEAGYRERLFPGRYPVAFVFFEIDGHLLDVNVHPNKKEVRFGNPVAVAGLLEESVRISLAGASAMDHTGKETFTGASAENLRENRAGYENGTKRQNAGVSANVLPEDTKNRAGGGDAVQSLTYGADESRVNCDTQGAAGHSHPGIQPVREQLEIRDLLAKKRQAEEKKTQESIPAKGQPSSYGFDVQRPEAEPFNFDALLPGNAIFNTYITATDGDAFYLIDQHAAHERINYERFVQSYLTAEKNEQVLLVPLTIDVPLRMADGETTWKEDLSRMGFDLEAFGENTFLVRAVPDFLTLTEAEDFLKSFIDSVSAEEKTGTPGIDRLILRACKASIKAHDLTSQEERRALLKELKSCRNPFSCPHGRPTFVRFPLREIEKMFKRIV